MNAIEVAANGGSLEEILEAMDEDYRREWPQAAIQWAVQLQQEYSPKTTNP